MDKTVIKSNYDSIKANTISAFNNKQLYKALDYIHAASSLAWKHHMGLWYDNDLENLLAKIEHSLRDNFHIKEKKKIKKRNVYITTNLTDIGGIIEVLRQWAKLLKPDFEKQSLHITHCYTSFKSITYSEHLLEDTQLEIKELSFRDSFSERTKDLTKYISDHSPDVIFLFIEPSDVIAIPAIYALKKKSKVIFLNHADQSFWLGRNIIDYLIDQREESARYSRDYRNMNNSYIVPLSTDIKPKNPPEEKWNIREDSTISLFIGSFHSVLGDKKINYFHVIFRLLKKFPNHYHVFITNPPSDKILEKYRIDVPDFKERFIIEGPHTDLAPYYGTVDFLIETFPILGGMVRIEAMVCKLPIVAFHNKKFHLFTGQCKLPPNYPFEATKEEEIINYSSRLIKDPDIRKKEGENLYYYYLEELSPAKIHKILCNIIEGIHKPSNLDNIEHISNYDLDYAGIYQIDVDFESCKKLLLLSILKESSFSFIERSNFYLKSLKNSEIKSKRLLLRYAFLSFVGWNGLSILLDILTLFG